MSHALAHRGPDGAGLVGLEGYAVIRSPESTAWQVAIAYRRLFIIDLTPAVAQPMWSIATAIGSRTTGEVHNYLEFRAELERLGHAFRTESDSRSFSLREWAKATSRRTPRGCPMLPTRRSGNSALCSWILRSVLFLWSIVMAIAPPRRGSLACMKNIC
jgi:hypothetical protein